MNDLILSEIGLVTHRLKNNKETQKVHLLFQSFFLTHIGDYKAALSAFAKLNKSFEENKSQWNHPPHDYLSALDGILDSLRSINYYDEMHFYVSKLVALDMNAYPEHFRLRVRKNVVIYELAALLGLGKIQAALQFVQKIDPSPASAQSVSDYDKHTEFLFYIAVVYYHVGEFKKAQKNLNEIIRLGKINLHSTVYKAARMLSMIMQFYDGNQEYLEYEIRSYRRAYQKQGKLLKVEKLLFKVIQLNPGSKISKIREAESNRILAMLDAIAHDKYEVQILKHFNFTKWIREIVYNDRKCY